MNTQYFLTEAENARIEYVIALDSAKLYAGSKSLKSLKKDAEFIRLTNKVASAKKLWYDFNTAALIQAKQEQIQSILN
ncbi:hypothetical protein [Pedobacter africanus]|uniref:Uncharacterized protein n=1 Tax=Pedobacter africanus TaxID=151894 RepID=A0A1W1ZDJ6_9SPHI|nr:hypothetical protein [Pedobacter africanus]SMC46108.1 hypothetical protein SAMN04488524_0597 [Pedobacter africanus]